MPRVTVIERTGAIRSLEAESGRSLMEALRAAGVEDLLALCGGCCCCGTCHVYIEIPVASLPPAGEDEEDMLSASAFRRPQSRLSCQIRMSEALDGLRVIIAPYG